MRLPDLPSVCWNQAILELIVVAAGCFIRMDDSTSLLAKRRFVRVAVEIDTANPLFEVLMFNLKVLICLSFGSDLNLNMFI